MHLFQLLLLGGLAALLVLAAATDLRSRTIANGLNLGVALLALPWWYALGLSGGEVLMQIALAIGVLAIFGACFAAGMMGGGDVKLLTALALWQPAGTLLAMLVWMALIGGVLTIVMLIAHRLRDSSRKLEIPYGVAIAAASLMIVANHILTLTRA